MEPEPGATGRTAEPEPDATGLNKQRVRRRPRGGHQEPEPGETGRSGARARDLTKIDLCPGPHPMDPCGGGAWWRLCPTPPGCHSIPRMPAPVGTATTIRSNTAALPLVLLSSSLGRGLGGVA